MSSFLNTNIKHEPSPIFDDDNEDDILDFLKSDIKCEPESILDYENDISKHETLGFNNDHIKCELVSMLDSEKNHLSDDKLDEEPTTINNDEEFDDTESNKDRISNDQFVIKNSSAELSNLSKNKTQPTNESSANKKQYKCDVCPESFCVSDELATHIKTYHKVEPIPHNRCDEENQSCHLFYQLCLLCSKSFKSVGSLKRHYDRFHSAKNGQKPEPCNVCGKSVIALKEHICPAHNDDKSFKCPECSSSFINKSQLKEHTQLKHNKIRKSTYLCSECGKLCQSWIELQRHMREHTGEKSFKCTLCNKKYKENHKLVIHMRSHTGERPYVCSFCNKGFYTSQVLKHHVRTHTAEKPYKCDTCSHTFTRKYTLDMHKKIHV